MVNAKFNTKEWKIQTIGRRCIHCGIFIHKNSKYDFCCPKHAMFDAMKKTGKEYSEVFGEGQILSYAKFNSPVALDKDNTLTVTWTLNMK